MSSTTAHLKPTVRVHLWLETSEGLVFGPGRAQLLAKLAECGSLRKAAKELGMSYRAAWGKIKKTEEIIGERLVIRDKNKKSGYELSNAGRLLLEGFLSWYNEVEEFAVHRAGELLPWHVTKFDDTSTK